MPLKVLLAGFTEKTDSEFIETLQGFGGVLVTLANSGDNILDILSRDNFDLAALAQTVNGMDGLHLARKMVKQSPMVNCAVSNSLPKDEFHEKAEGLGLLAQLPVRPEAGDAQELIQKAIHIKSLSTPS